MVFLGHQILFFGVRRSYFADRSRANKTSEKLRFSRGTGGLNYQDLGLNKSALSFAAGFATWVKDATDYMIMMSKII